MIANGTKVRLVQTTTEGLSSSNMQEYGNESLIIDVSGSGIYLGNNNSAIRLSPSLDHTHSKTDITGLENDLNDILLEVQTNERVTSSAISDIYSKLELIPGSGESDTNVKTVEYVIDDSVDINNLNGYGDVIDVDTMNAMFSTDVLIVDVYIEGLRQKIAFHSMITMSDESKAFKCDLSELNKTSFLALISKSDGNGTITFLSTPKGSCEIFINADAAEMYNKVAIYYNAINTGLSAPSFILIDDTYNISDVISFCPVTVIKYGNVFLIKYISGMQEGSITSKTYTLTKTSITLEDTTKISKHLTHLGSSGHGSYTEELIPGSYYKYSNYSELILTLGDDSYSGVKQYMVRIDTSADGITLSMPTNIKWANGLEDIIDGVFVPQPSCTYEISITGNTSMHLLGTYLKYNN